MHIKEKNSNHQYGLILPFNILAVFFFVVLVVTE